MCPIGGLRPGSVVRMQKSYFSAININILVLAVGEPFFHEQKHEMLQDERGWARKLTLLTWSGVHEVTYYDHQTVELLEER